MPKAPKDQIAHDSVQTSFLIYVYDGKRVVGRRRDNFTDSVKACRVLFPSIPQTHQISFYTQNLVICEGEPARLLPEVWSDLIPHLKSVNVVSEPPALQLATSVDLSKSLTLQFVCSGRDEPLSVTVRRKMRFSTIFSAVTSKLGVCPDDYRMNYQDMRILPDSTPAELDMENNDQVWMYREQKGGKPVIYLFSPTTIEASVKLSLVPEWDFSAIYPVVFGDKPLTSRREVEWRVRTHEDGDLSELNTGLEVSYLFWEAHTLPKLLDSPPPSPLLQAGVDTVRLTESFVPNEAVVTNENAVLLSISKITPYLDATLKTLGLHTEARTSFITYWLPSFLKHKHIALRAAWKYCNDVIV